MGNDNMRENSKLPVLCPEYGTPPSLLHIVWGEFNRVGENATLDRVGRRGSVIIGDLRSHCDKTISSMPHRQKLAVDWYLLQQKIASNDLPTDLKTKETPNAYDLMEDGYAPFYAWRMHFGWDAFDVANALNITVKKYAQIENKRINANFCELKIFCHLFGLNPIDVIEWDGVLTSDEIDLAVDVFNNPDDYVWEKFEKQDLTHILENTIVEDDVMGNISSIADEYDEDTPRGKVIISFIDWLKINDGNSFWKDLSVLNVAQSVKNDCLLHCHKYEKRSYDANNKAQESLDACNASGPLIFGESNWPAYRDSTIMFLKLMSDESIDIAVQSLRAMFLEYVEPDFRFIDPADVEDMADDILIKLSAYVEMSEQDEEFSKESVNFKAMAEEIERFMNDHFETLERYDMRQKLLRDVKGVEIFCSGDPNLCRGA